MRKLKIAFRFLVSIPFIAIFLPMGILVAVMVSSLVIFVGAHRYAFQGKVDFPWNWTVDILQTLACDFGIKDLIENIREQK